MTKAEALHKWFNSALKKVEQVPQKDESGNWELIPTETDKFIPFYPSSAVPDDVIFPWGTYELTTAAWGAGEVGITVNLWFYTDDEFPPNNAAERLSERIGLGGAVIPCDNGFIWLKRGSPWCQNVVDEENKGVKRRYINVSAEYLTKN